VAARAGRPHKTDCDPSTDVNLCAFEREYSIEAARHPEYVVEVPAPAGGAKGERPSAVATRPLTPSSSRALGSYAMLRIATGKDPSLTEGPLHTRPTTPACARSTSRDGNHELLSRVCVGEARDLHIHQAGVLPRLHHGRFRQGGVPLGADGPDCAITSD
jgi:hypothetical protein